MTKPDEKKILDIFLNFEDEEDLLNREIQGVFFWKILRVSLHRSINNIEARKKPKKQTIFKLFDYTYRSVFYSNGIRQRLYFENPRKIKTDDGYYDPYTHHYIEKQMTCDRLSFQIIDDGYFGEHFEPADGVRKFNHSIYYDYIYKLYQKIFFPEFSADEQMYLDQLGKQIYSIFNISLDLSELVRIQLRVFKFQLKKYGKIFDKKQNKEVYLVCSYGKEGMIEAAHLRGIRVIELQHGLMGQYQLGYHFPKATTVPYFPDKLVVFGELWKDITSLPKIDLEVYGYPHLTQKLKSYTKAIKKENQVLVISQQSIASSLINFVLVAAANNPNHRFVYRLHPKEREDWKVMYPELTQSNITNLEVDDSTSGLYDKISNSAFVIGVSSQTIFECLMLDSNVILVNLNGIEHMNFLVDKGYVIKVDQDQKIELDKLNFKNIHIDKNYIYKQ